MLQEIIADRIKKEGAISFRDFMEMALYYPDYGYYTSADTEIGRSGDFYTSAHIHPVFGALIGKQIAEMWEAMGRPDSFYIIEMGAGKGYVAHDMLAYLEGTEFFEAVHYVIVEINKHLIKKQQQLLHRYHDKIHWALTLKETTSVTGCLFSNELLDAFPVHLIYYDGGKLHEIYVTIKQDNFCEVYEECSLEIINYLHEFSISLPRDYRTEVNLDIRKWLKDVSSTIGNGFIFTIDYGYSAAEYYSPLRKAGTIMCYYRHQINDNPYQHVGLQDISAHVNFSAVKKWGEEYGFDCLGFAPQGTFLVSLRIDETLQANYAKDDFTHHDIYAVSRLVSPEGLGESHKVLIQNRGNIKQLLSGYSLRNKRNLL